MKNFKLRTKLIALGISLTVLPMIFATAINFYQNRITTKAATEATEVLAKTDLDHIAKSVYSLCQAQQETIQQAVNSSLKVAHNIMTRAGQVNFAEETVSWNAVNQYTHQTNTAQLPKMQLGDLWLGNNTDINSSSPIVDTVQDLVGGTCTVFQRMNETGDMLRVCTNVEKTDGSRAIGTFIPKTNPDGTPNPVIATLLRGQTYRGRAYVVNKWYITAYEPIVDNTNKVVGALYVGVPQENITSLRKAIMDIKCGKTGYVYVLSSTGDYVVSKDGKRDGENIWNAKDADGVPFIQEICKKALASEGRIVEQKYPWKNASDSAARMKIARIIYFEPWDWVIGASAYEDDFYDSVRTIQKTSSTCTTIYAVVILISLTATCLTWFVVSTRLTGRITRIVKLLAQNSRIVLRASSEVSASSQSLAQGATEQAAGLEETSSSLEEMSSMTRQNADNAVQANALSNEANEAAQNGGEAMQRMTVAIDDIQKSADETAKIIKVIDEIAFQTNLLALNAAVEAARAGEAGKGFAVVAEEVRNLAMRSAEAAKETSSLIEESVKKSKNGVEISGEVAGVLDTIASRVSKTSDLISEIAAASQEQTQGIDQINVAITQMDQVTQQNASCAEESASAAEELTAQSRSLKQAVDQLIGLVDSSSSALEDVNTTVNNPAGETGGTQWSEDLYHQIAKTGNAAGKGKQKVELTTG